MSAISPSCSVCQKPMQVLSCSLKTEPSFCSHVCHNLFFLNVMNIKKIPESQQIIPGRFSPTPHNTPQINSLPATLLPINIENLNLNDDVKTCTYTNVSGAKNITGKEKPL